MKKSITLSQEAYVEGYDGSFLRFTDEDGSELVGGIWGAYYKASAEDELGNHYYVCWEITNRAAFEAGEEEYACDWDYPTIVYDSDGRNVTDLVEVCLIKPLYGLAC